MNLVCGKGVDTMESGDGVIQRCKQLQFWSGVIVIPT